MTPAIEVTGLSVSYGNGVIALDDVNLSLSPARVVALVGMNGAGKSTLFAALLGLIQPQRGRIRIGGHSVEQARRSGMIGHVPQRESVDWDFPLCVAEVVMSGRHAQLGLTRRPRAADHAAVRAALDDVGLAALADRQIGQLSGGQRKRVFIARCIAQGAQTLLLDEPFAGVDRESEALISAVLRELSARGATVVVSTHGLHALSELADEALLLRRRILFHGPVDEALSPPRLAEAFGLDPTAQAEPDQEAG